MIYPGAKTIISIKSAKSLSCKESQYASFDFGIINENIKNILPKNINDSMKINLSGKNTFLYEQAGGSGSRDIYFIEFSSTETFVIITWYPSCLGFSTEKIKLRESVISTFKFTNTNLETSDWKTYRNDEYGFEFRYPAKWGEMSKNNNLMELNCIPSANEHIVGLEYSIPVLFVGLACENYMFETKDLIDTVPKKINIGGRESYFYEYTSATNYTNKEIFIPLHDGIYIYLYHSYKSTPQYTPLSTNELNEIISTFKFTK